MVRALDLFQHSADTHHISLTALNKLCATKSEAVVAGNAGAVRLAVRALRSFPEDLLVVGVAFYVLGTLVQLQQFREETLRLNATKLSVAAVRRCANDGIVQAGACRCLAGLCGFDEAVALDALEVDRTVAADALSMGAMELTLAVLRTHRSRSWASSSASALLNTLCLDKTHAVKAKQLGAPALLQAAMKANPSDEDVQRFASAALARIQRFVDAACARADAKMAELIAGEEAAKGGKVLKKAGNSKNKSKSTEGVAATPPPLPPPLSPPQPPVDADGEPALTKAQIKRRKAKAAAAARKAATASSSAAAGEVEEEVEEESDTSSGDSELPLSRPPIDFSKDTEFRRRLPPVINSPLVISPELFAASDAILAAHAALYAPNPSTQPVVEGPSPHVTGHAAGEEEGADAPDGASLATMSSPRAAGPPASAPLASSAHAAGGSEGGDATDARRPSVPAASPPAAAAASAAPASPADLAAAAGSDRDVPPATLSRGALVPSASVQAPPTHGLLPPAQRVEALAAENEALRAEVAALRARMTELEARL